MADTATGYAFGAILSGIALIGATVEEFGVRNKKVVALTADVMAMTPFIESLKQSPATSGVHNRLQRLLVLLAEIRQWIRAFGAKSSAEHFLLAIQHKRDVDKFHAQIQALKAELGFEMDVGNFQAHNRIAAQMGEMIETLRASAPAADFAMFERVLQLQQQLAVLQAATAARTDVWRERVEFLYDHVPRLQLVYRDVAQMLEIESLKGRGCPHKVYRTYLYEYEQLQANPELEVQLREMWRNNPQLQRRYKYDIITFLRGTNWGQLKALWDITDNSLQDDLARERDLVQLYAQSPEIRARFATLDDFLVQGFKTYADIHREFLET